MPIQEQLSLAEQRRLLCWAQSHPRAMLEDTLPWRYRHHRVSSAYRLAPIAWLCVHVPAGVLVALALARR